ncbi:MAG: sugar ABC transporter permease [Actinomycetota bacterium]|nr:sugar ABC transporter permease [Actinomycetota bacterium]
MVQSTAPAASGRGLTRQNNLVGWAFTSPFLAVFGVFLALPIVASLMVSFTDFDLGDISNPVGTDFIGLSNYSEAVADPKFRKAAFNTGLFVVFGVPLTILLGLAASVALNSGIRRFRALFRVGYYLPVVTSIVAIAVIWRFMLQPEGGVLNVMLGYLGLEGPNWLGSSTFAMPSIIALGVWRNMGFVMVILLAALQGIDEQYYDAAKVDGARTWQTFRYVTLPLLRPGMLFAAVITSIGYLQVMEEPFVMTAGGPLDSTLTLTMYVYEQGFHFFNLGYASAMAYLLFIAIALLTALQFRVLRAQT